MSCVGIVARSRTRTRIFTETYEWLASLVVSNIPILMYRESIKYQRDKCANAYSELSAKLEDATRGLSDTSVNRVKLNALVYRLLQEFYFHLEMDLKKQSSCALTVGNLGLDHGSR